MRARPMHRPDSEPQTGAPTPRPGRRRQAAQL